MNLCVCVCPSLWKCPRGHGCTGGQASSVLTASVPAGTEQQRVQERLTLRLPQQHRGRPQLPHRAFLRPDPRLRDPQAQQAAPTQLPVPPVLQQRTLHQGLPPGKAAWPWRPLRALAGLWTSLRGRRRQNSSPGPLPPAPRPLIAGHHFFVPSGFPEAG